MEKELKAQNKIGMVKIHSYLPSSPRRTEKIGRVSITATSGFFAKTSSIFLKIATQCSKSKMIKNCVHIFLI